MTSSGPNRAGTAAAGGTLSGAEELQKVFKTLADPTRIRILRLLEQEELIVGELMDILGMAQSRVSRHLAVLREAGLLADRREGMKHGRFREPASKAIRPPHETTPSSAAPSPHARRAAAEASSTWSVRSGTR